MRKVTQIQTMVSGQEGESGELVALCDDGSLWLLDLGTEGAAYQRLPSPPAEDAPAA